MTEVLNFIKEIASPYIAPVLGLVATVITIIIFIKTKGFGKLFGFLKTIVLFITGNDEEKSLMGKVKKELADNLVEIKKDYDNVKKDVLVKIESSETQNLILGEMLSIIVENSNLPVETKERFKILKSKLNFDNESDYVENLITENKKLKEIIDCYEHQINDNVGEPEAQIPKKNTTVVN